MKEALQNESIIVSFEVEIPTRPPTWAPDAPEVIWKETSSRTATCETETEIMELPMKPPTVGSVKMSKVLQ